MVIRMRTRRTAIFLALSLLLAPRAAVTPTAQAGGSLRLHIARHGETDWNLQHRLQGWTDRSLDETGRKQAAALAEIAQGRSTSMRSTPARCRAQSRYRPDRRGKSADGERVSTGFGSGITATSRAGRTPDTEYLRRMNDWNDRLDDGESLNQLLARTRESLVQIRREHSAGNVLIVAHRITNQMVLRALLDLTPEETVKITQDNDEVYSWNSTPARNRGCGN